MDANVFTANMSDEERARYDAHMNGEATVEEVAPETFEPIYAANLAAMRKQNAELFNENLAEFLQQLAMVFPHHAAEVETRMDMLKGLLITEGDEVLVRHFHTHSKPVHDILAEHEGEGDWPDKVARMLQAHGDACTSAFGVDLRELWRDLDDCGKGAVADYIKTAWAFNKLYHSAEDVVNEMRKDFEEARLAAERVFDEATAKGQKLTRRELQQRIEETVKATMSQRMEDAPEA